MPGTGSAGPVRVEARRRVQHLGVDPVDVADLISDERRVREVGVGARRRAPVEALAGTDRACGGPLELPPTAGLPGSRACGRAISQVSGSRRSCAHSCGCHAPSRSSCRRRRRRQLAAWRTRAAGAGAPAGDAPEAPWPGRASSCAHLGRRTRDRSSPARTGTCRRVRRETHGRERARRAPRHPSGSGSRARSRRERPGSRARPPRIPA